MALRKGPRIARILRRGSTRAEWGLWCALREAPLPCKVRRQHPLGPDIADFALPALSLVIELDGSQHAEQVDADELRTQALARLRYRVLRFWNNEVFENLEGVIEKILEEVSRTSLPPPPHPGPLRPRGRRGSARDNP